jgi:hypothetical protein
MPCITRRDLTPEEWRSLLEVHREAAWLPRNMKERLMCLDLIARSPPHALTGVGLRVVRDGIQDAMASIRKR